jgi:hypothetical protein
VPGAIDNSGLSLRSDYFGDPLAWRAFCDLLMDIFGIDVTPLEILGCADAALAHGRFLTGFLFAPTLLRCCGPAFRHGAP